MEMGKSMCGCPHHKVVPLCITLIGLAFLAGQMNWIAWSTANAVWPILLIIIGLTKLMGPGCKCDMPK